MNSSPSASIANHSARNGIGASLGRGKAVAGIGASVGECGPSQRGSAVAIASAHREPQAAVATLTSAVAHGHVTYNSALERAWNQSGRAVLAMNCALAGLETAAGPAAQRRR